MGAITEKTFTSAFSTTWSSYERMGLPTGSRNHAPQVVSISAIAPGSSGSATLSLILYDTKDTTDPVKRRYEAAITIGSTRTGGDGSSGGYLCAVAFAASGTEKQDIMPGDPGPNLEWRWGIRTFDTIESIKVICAYDEVI